jgi:hypothetical protein
MSRPPRALGLRVSAIVPQQKLREPMTRTEQIGVDGFAAPQHIADRFFQRTRNVNRVSAPARYRMAS